MRKFTYVGLSLTLLTALFTSCSSDSELDNPTAAADKVVTFGVHKGFAEDTITRAAQQPETKRIILSDGLLVDATLVDEGNMPGTRATTTYEPITTGTGMAFVCSGTQIVRKQDIAVHDGQITVMVPGEGTYNIYMYLNEDSNLGLANATIPDNDITNVTLANRSMGSRDDYVMVPGISASSATLGSPITFTPLGSEVRVTTNAGITPLVAFETTVNGIQAEQVTAVHVADGSYTLGTPSTTGQQLNKDNSGNSDTPYTTSLTSDGARFCSLNQLDEQTAVLTINAISGPDGTNANTRKAYSSANTMKFTHTYQNGHRYNLILNLATPIFGYEYVDPATHVADGAVHSDIQSVDGAQYSGSATWPCTTGRPQYYKWDSNTIYPAEFNSFLPIGVPDNATFSCAKCPTYKQLSWYLKGGSYWDDGRWYCPNGFITSSVTMEQNVSVHTGGRWFKKLSQIEGYTDPNLGNNGARAAYNGLLPITNATTLQNGKPGVVKLTTGDDAHQNPNDWFFLPAAGYYDHFEETGDRFKGLGEFGGYWSSTAFLSDVIAYALEFDRTQVSSTSIFPFGFIFVPGEGRAQGFCLWHAQ